MSQPEGGWSYVVQDGPTFSSTKVGYKGLESIIEQLAEYRHANGLPGGDPEHDIALTYMDSHPWLIEQEDDSGTIEVDSESWIHSTWRSYPLQMAEARVRDDRFKQCEECRFFEPLDTNSISEEGLRRLLLMNPARVRLEHGWCTARGWVPSVAVQLQKPEKFTEEKRVLPECWLT